MLNNYKSQVSGFLVEAGKRINTTSDFWIGARSYGLPGSWNWTDGTSFDFTDWKIPATVGSFCGAFDIANGFWNPMDCSSKKSYVCKTDETATTATTIKPSKPCPNEWFYFEETNSCYFWADSSDWPTAENTCKSFGAHLMSVHSFAEANFTKTIYNGKFWIGLYSNSNPVDWNSTWQYTDGSPVDYTKWGNHQSHDNSRCVQLRYDMYFENLNCTTINYGICKKPSTKVLPTVTATITSTTQASPYCINDWFYNSNTSSCYTLTPSVNWTQAEEYCLFNHAHLTSFHDRYELNFLYYTFRQATSYSDAWNGLFSTDQGMTWQFTDGSDFNYRPWSQGYPIRNSTYCGVYDLGSNYLQNSRCDYSNYGICKRSAVL
uniref:C-type lectin domain-containing protein n=1 Tax=Panagrolaimus davidi TaxID=227884 RepID=A0A914QQL6_9BILA